MGTQNATTDRFRKPQPQDEIWKERLLQHLEFLERDDQIELWEDRRIGAGKNWLEEIKEAMDTARVAVLLISVNFLTSEFILPKELVRLLEKSSGVRPAMCNSSLDGIQNYGLTVSFRVFDVFPVALRTCTLNSPGT